MTHALGEVCKGKKGGAGWVRRRVKIKEGEGGWVQIADIEGVYDVFLSRYEHKNCLLNRSNSLCQCAGFTHSLSLSSCSHLGQPASLRVTNTRFGEGTETLSGSGKCWRRTTLL